MRLLRLYLIVLSIFGASLPSYAARHFSGDCGEVIQNIQVATGFRRRGESLDSYLSALERSGLFRNAGEADREIRLNLAKRKYDGEDLSDEDIAKSIGAICKSQYTAPILTPQEQDMADRQASNETFTPQGQKIRGCSDRGGVFYQALAMRDLGRSPQEAFEQIKSMEIKGKYPITIDYIKNAINLVYFDQGFINAGPDAVSMQVRDLCMRDGKPKFQPLK